MYFKPGQEIETKIVAISGDCVFLDLNAKSEGILDVSEVKDGQGNITVKEGDLIKVYFLHEKNGEMIFTKRISSEKGTSENLKTAWENHIPVQGTVEEEIKGGFRIKAGEVQAFCPFSQIDYKEKKEPSSYIGKTYSFYVQEYKENGKNIVLSRRILLEEENSSRMESLKDSIVPGAKVKGTVKSLHKFGAFVDVKGLQVLVPISEISYERIDDISSVLKEGEEVTGIIINTDWEHNKISMSLKACMTAPWEKVTENFHVGEKYPGKVQKLTNFGIIVSLGNGIDGLLHISELQKLEGFSSLNKMFKKGDDISVIISEINKDKKRISLKTPQSQDEDAITRKYLESQDEGETYNPFKALLKK